MSTNAVITHTIHHYEDEPEMLRWVPGVLLNRYWSRFPQWIADEGRYKDHPDGRTTFELHVNGSVHEIEYRIYKDLSEFNRDFHGKHSDVALIDVMDKGNQPLGLQVYQTVIGVLDKSSVFLLTSFPSLVNIEVLDGHVLSKPIDATELADHLMSTLRIGG
jgi:hypothetical protein